MLKMSRRAKRMERSHKRKRPFTGFNLVSLMDIFTILVFFLLVNSSDVQVLPSTKSVKLPESSAVQKAKETIVILVNEQDILVQGRKVAKVNAANDPTVTVIESLKSELIRQAIKSRKRASKDKPFNGEVTIMGDKDIQFSLLKKIMLTCAQSRYGRISLAVLHKDKSSS